MTELQDRFNVDERTELRQLHRELDNTARDCRLLHFKVPCLVTSAPSSGGSRGGRRSERAKSDVIFLLGDPDFL